MAVALSSEACIIDASANNAEQLNKQTNKQNTMKTTTTERFTAAMLFNADKALVQQLRDEHDLPEKEMMRVILNVASNNAELIAAEVAAIKDAAEAERAAVKNLRTQERETAKAEKAVQREAIKAQKAAAKEAKKAEREAAKMAEMAEKAAAADVTVITLTPPAAEQLEPVAE
jgi:hypothetical protein